MAALASPSLADGVADSPEASDVEGNPPTAATPAPPSSSYRGVALRRSTGLWRAAIKVQRVTHDLGSYREEADAARAYDMAAVCARGLDADLNFPVADYVAHAARLQGMALDELARQLRQQAGAAGGPRGGARSSRFQGIRWNKSGGGGGKWEAVIKVGGRTVYLGTYDTEAAAAQAYDQGVLLRWAQGISTCVVGLGLPALNFPPDLYGGLVGAAEEGEKEGAGEEGEKEGEEGLAGEARSGEADAADAADEPPPPPPELLGKRYVEAVLVACRHYNSASSAVKSALGAGVGDGVDADDDGG